MTHVLDYWNEVSDGGVLSEIQQLKVRLVAAERTIESLTRQIYDERLRHGEEMRRLERKLREARG